MAEITRKSVLLDLLRMKQSELKICSANYDGLTPMKNMEDAWQKRRQEIDILKDLIHALDSEHVRRAIADWQKEVMDHGPSALKLDGNEPEAVLREK